MLDNHYTHEGYGLISNINIFGARISTYTFFVGLGILLGVVYYYFLTYKNKKKSPHSYWIVVSAMGGGFLGSKIIFILENMKYIDFSNTQNILSLILTGKSIVGGLLGGYLGVLIYKKIANIQRLRFGNEIAIPVLLAMAIGRIGCFLSGCCAGIVVNKYIGINFGDGLFRLPTQLIEALFCIILMIYFHYQKKHKDLKPGELFKKLIVYYLSFRFIIEFIRINPRVLWIFTSYQLACVLIIIFVSLMEKRKNIKS